MVFNGAQFYGCYFFGAGQIEQNTAVWPGGAHHLLPARRLCRAATAELRPPSPRAPPSPPRPPPPPSLPPPGRPPHAPLPSSARGPVDADPPLVASPFLQCAWAQWTLTDPIIAPQGGAATVELDDDSVLAFTPNVLLWEAAAMRRRRARCAVRAPRARRRRYYT